MEQNDALTHYADPNYDPVKAHEYYLRVRELKNNPKKAEEPAPVKTRTSSSATTSTPTRATTTQNKGTALREKVKEKASLRNSKNAAWAIAERIRLEKERQDKMDALPPIPTNISEAQKAILIAQRQKDIAKIVKDYESEYQKTIDILEPAKDEASRAKTKKRNDALKTLKDKVQEAKKTYETARNKLKENYNNTLKNTRSKSQSRSEVM